MTDKFKAVLKLLERRIKKREFSRDDAIKFLSYDNRWLEPSNVDVFLKNCISMNLIKKIDDEKYQINFETSNIEIPIDLTITREDLEKYSVNPKDSFKLIVERISKKTGIKKEEIVSEVNKMRKAYPFFSIEIIALMIARDKNIDVSDLFDMVEKSIFD
ncbi:MAG: DUF2240 family protein [Thermoplasmata archaeon]|jgi:hypothetical protein